VFSVRGHVVSALAGGAHLVVRLDELQSMRTQDLKGKRAEDAAVASGASQIYWLGQSVQNDLPALSEGPLVPHAASVFSTSLIQ